MSVRTAADIAAPVDVPAFTYPDSVGPDVDQVLVGRDALAQFLRSHIPAKADLRLNGSWWLFDSDTTGISVSASSLAELGNMVVAQTRAEVEAADPSGTHRSPRVWLVRLSNDDELLTWYGIPH